MSETKIGIRDQVWSCIRSPQKGFESVKAEDLWKGAVLILIVVVLSAYAGFNYASKTPLQLFFSSILSTPGPIPRQAIDAEAFRKNFIIFSTIGNGLKVITGWLVTAVLLHIFANLLAGKGSLKRLLAQMGFASIPLVIQQVLRLIDALTISKETVLGIMASRSFGRTLALRFMNGMLTTFTVFGIWATILTIIAVSINYESSNRRAATATILAYLVLIVVRLFLPI